MAIMYIRLHTVFTIPLLLTVLLACIMPGCGDMSRERKSGPASTFDVRRFPGPGQLAQSLDERGRVLIFLELEDPSDGTPLEVDPAWTFELSITAPNGTNVLPTPDPVIPRSWRNDAGVKLIGGFSAPTRGIYQIDVTSENCPPRKAQLILLPIN